MVVLCLRVMQKNVPLDTIMQLMVVQPMAFPPITVFSMVIWQPMTVVLFLMGI